MKICIMVPVIEVKRKAKLPYYMFLLNVIFKKHLKWLFIFTGTKEIVAGVDEETGDVFLSLEACEICDTSKFVWSKNYKQIGDCPRVAITTKGRT